MDTDRLQIRYVPVSQALDWELEGNAKKHDIGKLADSITENGFVDPPKFDAKLNKGMGGLVFGNGRTEALAWMESQGRTPPRGIALDDSGGWLMPVLFGVDARSEAAAQRFSIDHNNLTMAGGDFTALDMARMWESEGYAEMLQELADMDQLPLTVDADDLDLILSAEAGDEDEVSGLDDEDMGYESKFAVAVACDDEAHQEAVYNKLTDQGYKCKVLTL